MAYNMITTRCNMHCQHCCFSCDRQVGEHMPYETFKKILKKYHHIIDNGNGYVVLGGGEPTLHPRFWDMVNLGYYYGQVWLATNGKNKKDALKLAELAKKGYIACALSLDKWHDPIDPEVVSAFSEGLEVEYHYYYKQMFNRQDKKDMREIRTVLIPIQGGRARELEALRYYCPCPGIQFRPPDLIYPCGCDDAPTIGTVDKGIEDKQWKYYDIYNGCWKKTNAAYEEAKK